jgi:hypothetical protein
VKGLYAYLFNISRNFSGETKLISLNFFIAKNLLSPVITNLAFAVKAHSSSSIILKAQAVQ